MMYRLLKDLLDWKVNLYIKTCKEGKRRYEPVSVFLLATVLLLCTEFAECTALPDQNSNNIESNVYSQNPSLGVASGRTLDHGIFRHDKPFSSISPFPPRSDISLTSGNEGATIGLEQGQTTSSGSSPDNRDRYNSYDRFKRSVTTLNFHPKPKNESKTVGVKPMRIFKYVTEDDVLISPTHENRHNSHITVFHPLVSVINRRNETPQTEVSNADTNQKQRIVGGAKINLKAKLDKVISANEANKNNNESDNEFKGKAGGVTPSKPENILIFKPSLAIRKFGSRNKTSLIPSGKYTNGDENEDDQVGKGTIAAHTQAKTHRVHEESTDPNSSTVNDRSLIQPNLYFDSVVVLSEEGQKQLKEHQQKQSEQNREKTSDDGTSSSSAGADDDEKRNNNNGEITKNKIEAVAPSSSTKNVMGSGDKENKNDKKKISPSLNATNNSGKNGNTTTSKPTSKPVSEKKWNKKINATITTGGNKDKRIFKVVTKSSKNKTSVKTYSKTFLNMDDTDEDGSERPRRSPFQMPLNFQRNNAHMEPLARAALFRTTNGITRLRHMPLIKKKVMPRLIAPLPGKKSFRKTSMRTILPMKPMPLMPMLKKTPLPNLALVPGPVGPGPVGPPIAAIKVTHLNLSNMKNGNNNNNPLNSNNNNNNNGLSASNLMPNIVPNGVGNNIRSAGPSGPGKTDLIADSSRTTFSFKPLPEDVLLNQAASSYYSPTYKRFKKKLQTLIDTERELEEGGLSRWEESRYPSSRHHHSPSPKARHRSSSRSHNRRHHHYETHSHHRRGGHDHHSSHSQVPRHRPSSRGKKLPGAKYTYPKNAENIQDILKYFDDKSHPPSSHRGSDRSESSLDKFSKKHNNHHRHHSAHSSAGALPGHGHEPSHSVHPKLADLSGEFRDVHASLLKDIREFAKRPHLMQSHAGSDHSDSKIRSHLDSQEAHIFDPIDEIFGRPKPVRDLIKPDLYSLENIRERIALKRGKLGGRPNKDKDHHLNGDEHKHPFGDEHRNHGFHLDNFDDRDEFYDSHRHTRPHTEREHDTRSAEHSKNHVYHSKEEYDNHSPSRRNKYKDTSGDDSHTIYPSSHYSRKDSDVREQPFEYNSAEFPSTKDPPRKPVVLKRPSEPYRVKEAEPKKKPEHDYFWNTFRKEFDKQTPTVTYDSPLVIKPPQAPSVLHPYNPYNPYGPAGAASHTLQQKPLSVEDEDIVEIHTGHPRSHLPMQSPTAVPSFPTPAPHHDPMKQEKLKKMYMDVLHQKMQIEAALMQPQASPIVQAPSSVQFNHPPSLSSMHTSASLLPQHNPIQLSRIPHHITYPSSSPVTLSPLTGLMQRRKKPMRMKIHIYPNGHDGLEQGIEAANLLAAGGFGTSGFSASNPPGVVAPPPPKDMSVIKAPDSAMTSGPTGGPIPPTNPSGFGGTSSAITGPMGPVNVPSKNKNVVLHLHVHRRNDMLGPLELETEGSHPVPQTAKPINSFKEIFDEQLKPSEEDDSGRKSNLANHRMHQDDAEAETTSHSVQYNDTTRERDTHDDQEDSALSAHNEEDRERDKSSSMEAPIHDEKIEDVFHTIMKMRKKVDNRKKRS